jgi:toxin YoeB
MKRDVLFRGTSFNDFIEWKSTNTQIFNKVTELIEQTRTEPFSGLGKPEPLKHQFSGLWSKRISSEHRLVYKVTENAIEIISCKYHYV